MTIYIAKIHYSVNAHLLRKNPFMQRMSIYSMNVHLLGESPFMQWMSTYLANVHLLDENSFMQRISIYYTNIHLVGEMPFIPSIRLKPIYLANGHLLGKSPLFNKCPSIWRIPIYYLKNHLCNEYLSIRWYSHKFHYHESTTLITLLEGHQYRGSNPKLCDTGAAWKTPDSFIQI